MHKVVALLSLTVLVSGCKTLSHISLPNDEFPSFRCASDFNQKSISEQQVDDIRYLSHSNDNCKLVLGEMYETGHGVQQDLPKAKDIYESVARREPTAYSRLAVMAEEGTGGPVDLVAARDFYQRSIANPGNTKLELKVADFLENGKGGPQDLQGALKIYLKTGSWENLERLHGKGVSMTIEQQQRYNNVFVSRVQSSLRTKISAIEQNLAEEKISTPDGKPVQVQIEYTPGVSAPVVSLRQSSGDSAIDQKVMQAFSDYRFPGEPIMPAGQKSYQAIPIVRTDGKTDRERMRELTSK